MMGVNFAVVLLAIGLFGAVLFVLVMHLFKFYLHIKHRKLQPWLD